MDNKRILELAIETLEKHKAAIEAEIEELRGEMKGEITGETAKKVKATSPTASRYRPKTPAERKAQSDRMKAYWAAKKSQPAIAAAKKPTPAGPKRAPKSAATSKAISDGMRAYWARRKAELASKKTSTKPANKKAS